MCYAIQNREFYETVNKIATCVGNYAKYNSTKINLSLSLSLSLVNKRIE